MGKPMGLPKTGGRTKGTPNKRTIGFGETLEARGINLLDEILNQAARLSGREKMKVYLDLLPYQFPKRKPTDQASFLLGDFLDNLQPRELESLKDDIYRRIAANLSPEEHKKKYQEVVQLMNTLNEIEDDPDCADA
jgi:hypothetical protein